jgi:cysteine desulfurase
LQKISTISNLLKTTNILFHSDITQSLSTIDINVDEMGLDLASFSSHKIYGPKGIGALYVRTKSPRIKIKPLIFGGGHEKGLRSGTLNVPAIVGFGKACELVITQRTQDYEKLKNLRDTLQKKLIEKIPQIKINGDLDNRLPFNLSITFEGIEAEKLLKKSQNLALSAGAACTTAQIEPSHVLKAMGHSHHYALSTLRVGLGRNTSLEDIEATVETIARAVLELKQS